MNNAQRPRLLDAFCGAGGCTKGYQRAGFYVVGVDIKPQPRYCGDEFYQGDAIEYIQEHGHEFDVIHASPPCQAFCDLKDMYNAKQHADLLTPARAALQATGKPYVIENVPGAPMQNYITLCGTAFGLGTNNAELWRHRRFEVAPMIWMIPPCAHRLKPRVIGVYGGHGRDRRCTVPTKDFSTAECHEAMGIDWMTKAELSQAIPPAYTEWIGHQLLEVLE